MNDSSKFRLDLPLILPDVDDVEDHCVQRLTKALEGRPGISEAHIVRDANGQPQLCLHYDPAVVSMTRLRELVGSVGAQLSERFSHLTIRAEGSLHARAARGVAADLRSVPGVLEADVSGSGSIRIEYDQQLVSAEALRAKVAALGIRTAGVSPPPKDAASESPPKHSRSDDEHTDHDHSKHDHADHDHGKQGAGGHAGHDHSEGGLLGEKSELIFAALAGVLLAAGWLIERSGAGPVWLPTATYIAAYFFGGF